MTALRHCEEAQPTKQSRVGNGASPLRAPRFREALIYSVSSLRAAFSRERSVAGSNPEFMQYQMGMDRHVATLLMELLVELLAIRLSQQAGKSLVIAMTELFSVSLMDNPG